MLGGWSLPAFLVRFPWMTVDGPLKSMQSIPSSTNGSNRLLTLVSMSKA